MKYWFDSEFLEDGVTIDLISIAFVAEDGREYYAVNDDADWRRIEDDKWLMKNVRPHLPHYTEWKSKDIIAKEVLDFLTIDEGTPELWAWYSAYDHVVFAQLWGKMINLPKPLPMFTHDLRSLMDWALPPEQHHDLPRQPGGNHDALEDARHLKTRYDWVMQQKALNASLPGATLTEAELDALPVGSIVRFKYTGNSAVKGRAGDWQVGGFSKNYESKSLVNSKQGVHLIWKPNLLTKGLL